MDNLKPVGVAATMPGTDGFTMAAFKASDVPVGTNLYASPAIDAAPCSPPFTTDVPQCCGDPETCNDPCEPANTRPVAIHSGRGAVSWLPEGADLPEGAPLYAVPCANTCNFYVEGRACACRTSMAQTIALQRERIEELERDVHYSRNSVEGSK